MAKEPKVKTEYAFREGAILTFPNAKRANPNIIGRALADIAAANDGRLKPDAIVDAARVNSHPLHKHFEWNVEVAARAHWIYTARALTRAIIVVYPDEENRPPQRAWLSADDASGVSYHSIAEVVTNVDLKLAVLRRAERDLRSWQERYRELKEIVEIVETARRAIGARLAEHDDRIQPTA